MTSCRHVGLEDRPVVPELDALDGLLPDWFADAACLGHPEPGLWFPEGRGASPQAAQAVCEGCATREPCAAYAASEGFDVGGVRRGQHGRGEPADRVGT